MKRASSAPCLAEDQPDNRVKRVKSRIDEGDGPNSREYLQLALARVLELQRALNDDTYFTEEPNDLGELNNEDELMRHVLTKVFRDLPGTSRTKVSRIIELGTSERCTNELKKNRAKSIQLAGYDTCRKIAVDFMKKAVKAECFYRLPVRHRRCSVGSGEARDVTDRGEGSENSNYKLRMRMLTSLDLHLADKQRDYTARLMRH